MPEHDDLFATFTHQGLPVDPLPAAEVRRRGDRLRRRRTALVAVGSVAAVGSARLALPPGHDGVAGTTVTLGIRPENVAPAEAGTAGEFSIAMSANGRKFVGTLTDEADGEPKEWTGMRKSSGRGAGRMRGEKPSKRVAWLHELLLGKSTAALATGDADGAVDAAEKATALCCQTASGWEALAAAKEGTGDEEAAAAAREEAEWRKGIA